MKLAEGRLQSPGDTEAPEMWWSSRRGAWRGDAEAWRNGTLPEDVAAVSLAKDQGTGPLTITLMWMPPGS